MVPTGWTTVISLVLPRFFRFRAYLPTQADLHTKAVQKYWSIPCTKSTNIANISASQILSIFKIEVHQGIAQYLQWMFNSFAWNISLCIYIRSSFPIPFHMTSAFQSHPFWEVPSCLHHQDIAILSGQEPHWPTPILQSRRHHTCC